MFIGGQIWRICIIIFLDMTTKDISYMLSSEILRFLSEIKIDITTGEIMFLNTDFSWILG